MNPKSLTALFLGIPLALLTAGPARAVYIDFTSSEGYSNGALNGQPGSSGTWATTSTPSYFTVDTGNGGSLSISTSVNNPVAGYATPVDFTSGVTITTYIDFQFVQTAASISSSTTAFNLAYGTAQTSGASSVALAGFGRQANTTDGYRLTAFSALTTPISGTALGLDSSSGDNTSDVIRLTLTLTAASANTWNGAVSLFNVTTGTTLATLTRNGFANSGSNPIPSSLYGLIQISSGMTASSLESLTALGYATPVPEPGTVALLGLGLGATLLAVRRKRSSALR